MITAQRFVAAVDDAAREIREYSWGASGQEGKCDCIGLIMDALRKCGKKWPGVHGTNWAARNAMETLGALLIASDCFLGQVVFKARGPGNDRYNLPDGYKNSGDLLDYYHVGVVTSISPLVITHCTDVPGGIKRDTSLGSWAWGGILKYVNYQNEGGMDMDYPYYATVWSPNMYPVKVRKEPKANADVIKKIDKGEIVVVMGEIGTEEDGIWGFIRYGAVTGYMMKNFLKPLEDEDEDKNEQQDAPEEDGDEPQEAEFPVTLTSEEYNGILGALEVAVDVLKKARDEYEG